jgi:hypothetical protein
MKLKEFYIYLMQLSDSMTEDTEIFIGLDTAEGTRYLEPGMTYSYGTGASGDKRLTPTVVVFARDETEKRRIMG